MCCSDLWVCYSVGFVVVIFDMVRFVFSCLYSRWNGLLVIFVMGVSIMGGLMW